MNIPTFESCWAFSYMTGITSLMDAPHRTARSTYTNGLLGTLELLHAETLVFFLNWFAVHKTSAPVPGAHVSDATRARGVLALVFRSVCVRSKTLAAGLLVPSAECRSLLVGGRRDELAVT
jgi:hypothetical protein